jgi:hypothetical protein
MPAQQGDASNSYHHLDLNPGRKCQRWDVHACLNRSFQVAATGLGKGREGDKHVIPLARRSELAIALSVGFFFHYEGLQILPLRLALGLSAYRW